jgi:hypothetical protein
MGLGVIHGIPATDKTQQPVVEDFVGGGIVRPKLMSLNSSEHGTEVGKASRPLNRGVPSRRSRRGRKR